MAAVLFDEEYFRASFPEFKDPDISAERIRAAFDTARLICGDGDGSPVPYDPERGIFTRRDLLALLTRHVWALETRGGSASGALVSARQGSVSANFSAPSVKGAEWFVQTPWGLAYWQASAAYRAGGKYYVGEGG